MAGKQAKIIAEPEVAAVLRYVRARRHGTRNVVMVLLSTKAGLRACEIARLTWSMVLAADGKVGTTIELQDRIAKKQSGRTIPMHRELRRALVHLYRQSDRTGTVIKSERGTGKQMTADAVSNWFGLVYRAVGLAGASSHSGRRTFITKAARNVHRTGGSLRDVQQLAGHRNITITQGYIEGDSRAKQRLVSMI